MNKFKNHVLPALLLAVSSVIIIVGIVIYSLFGFNTLAERPKTYTFEVRYNVTVANDNAKMKEIEDFCEKAFKESGLTVVSKETVPYIDSSSLVDTTDAVLRYTFNSSKKLGEIAEKVNAAFRPTETEEGDTDSWIGLADIYAGWNEIESDLLVDVAWQEFAWRGAIAVAVGAIVAFIYITVRYGVSLGVAGLVCCAHDALLTAAFFALTRIPVFAAAPLLYAAIAALVSIVLWLIFANKLRSAFKNEANNATSSAELICTTSKASKKSILVAAAVLCAVIAILSVVAWSGASLFVLPALVAVVLPVYSTLLIGPGVCTPIREGFDKLRASKKIGYTGKKKKAETDKE